MASAARVSNEAALLERDTRELPSHAPHPPVPAELPSSNQVATHTEIRPEMSYSPFRLVASKVALPEIMAVLATKYTIDRDVVLDVYPATPLQGACSSFQRPSRDTLLTLWLQRV